MSDWLKVNDDRIDSYHRLIVLFNGKQYIWILQYLDEGGEEIGNTGSSELYETAGKAIADAYRYYHEHGMGDRE